MACAQCKKKIKKETSKGHSERVGKWGVGSESKLHARGFGIRFFLFFSFFMSQLEPLKFF